MDLSHALDSWRAAQHDTVLTACTWLVQALEPDNEVKTWLSLLTTGSSPHGLLEAELSLPAQRIDSKPPRPEARLAMLRNRASLTPTACKQTVRLPFAQMQN